jgi:hypothetical protein
MRHLRVIAAIKKHLWRSTLCLIKQLQLQHLILKGLPEVDILSNKFTVMLVSLRIWILTHSLCNTYFSYIIYMQLLSIYDIHLIHDITFAVHSTLEMTFDG